MNHFEAAGSQSVMEIDSIRCNEEEVYAIGDVPDGYIAILQDNLMERHGECQVHFALPSGMANGVVIDKENLSDSLVLVNLPHENISHSRGREAIQMMFQEYLRELIGQNDSSIEEHFVLNMKVCSGLEYGLVEMNQDEEVDIPFDHEGDRRQEKFRLY